MTLLGKINLVAAYHDPKFKFKPAKFRGSISVQIMYSSSVTPSHSESLYY